VSPARTSLAALAAGLTVLAALAAGLTVLSAEGVVCAQAALAGADGAEHGGTWMKAARDA
jgi:hypothetical protein